MKLEEAAAICYGDKYLLRILSTNELFKMRDAAEILNPYGLMDKIIMQDIYAEIEKRFGK